MAKALFTTVFEDSDLVVVNKAPGVPTIPSRDPDEADLLSLVSQKYGEVLTVHRIDRNTSGIVIFARNPDAHRGLSQRFMDRQVEKVYYAIVRGVPTNSTGVIDAPIETGKQGKSRISSAGKPSLTRFEIIEAYRGFAFLKLMPSTGRQHQVRVHLAHIGHPLVVDPVYSSHKSFNIADIKRRGLKGSSDSLTPLLYRTPLHAFSIGFDLDGQRYFEAIVPKDIRATLNQLRKWRKL